MEQDVKAKDIIIPSVQEVALEELEDTALAQLTPKQQRFVHLYLSGGYSVPQIAKLLNMSYPGVRKWLKNPDIKGYIDQYQKEEDEIITQGLKALRTKALTKLGELIDSNIDGVALQAVNNVLDKTGHKATSKQEVDITVKTFEQQIIELSHSTDSEKKFVETSYEIVDNEEE